MPSLNTFQNIQQRALWVAFEGLELLTATLALGEYFSSEHAMDFKQKFPLGRSMAVPLSQRWTVQRNNMTYNPQAMDRPYTTITVDQTATIPLEWESIEAALDMERGQERIRKYYIKPAVDYIRQAIETDLATFAYQNTNMITTGALGTNPASYDATSANALQALQEMNCPTDGLGLFLPPAVNRAVKTAGIGYFNPTVDLSKQFRSGFVERTDSFDWYASTSLVTHTAGTWANTALLKVSGASQSGSTLNIVCTTGDTFNAGDKFSIANVNQVNQMTRQTTSTATAGTKTFTITANATGASSAAALSIYPPIYGPLSHYQNVDALPADQALLTMWPGTSAPSAKSGKVGLALYPGAFFIAGVSLEKPTAVEFCEEQTDPKTGISIRVIKQWDSVQSRMITRMDALWGRGVGLAEQCAVAIPCA